MNIFQYAMEMEKDGEKLYREMASSASEPGIAQILTSLADAEVRHYEVLLKLLENREAGLSKDSLPTEAKNIFRKMLDEGMNVEPDTHHTELYTMAMDLESKSWEFYLSKAGEVEDPTSREILLLISEEEKRHYMILESILELLTRAEPGNWLENAEWYHFDEY